MSDQRTAMDVLWKLEIVYNGVYADKQLSKNAAKILYDDLLARLPEKQERHTTPAFDGMADVDFADKENAYRGGYNHALGEVRAILRAYFLAGEDGAV